MAILWRTWTDHFGYAPSIFYPKVRVWRARRQGSRQGTPLIMTAFALHPGVQGRNFFGTRFPFDRGTHCTQSASTDRGLSSHSALKSSARTSNCP